MIKLVIADLDGTLYHDNVISEETKNMINRLRNDGIIFTIATGRHFTGSVGIIEELEVKGPVICSNGAYVGIPEEQLILKEVLIDTDLVLKVINRLYETKSTFLLYTSKRIVGTQESRDALYQRIGNFPAKIVSLEEMSNYVDEGVVKILIIEPNETTFKKLFEELQEYQEASVVSSNNSFIDIGCKQSSKGHSLQVICDYYNVKLNEVFAIGDQENDISLIQEAHIGVAMGNGTDLLKSKADFVTKSIQEEGFSYAVKKLIYEES